MEVRYLCGSVDEWQRRRIKDLEENTISYADMAWKIEDRILPDCKQMYANSHFMTTLFSTNMTRGFENENGLTVYPLEEKLNIFSMIRVFCHTGLVMFKRGETILKTIERYAAFHFYGMTEGKNVLRRLILDNLIPSNAMTAFEYAVHRDDKDLLTDIKSYICNYAFLVFRHKSLFCIKRDSMSEFIELCRSDSLNIQEPDLLSNLYRFCDKKIGDKEYLEFEKPFDIFNHRFDKISLWESLRLTSITLEDFMGFVQKHPHAMGDDSKFRVMQTIFSPESQGKKRKRFQVVSSYPRNLNFRPADNPQADITHWERDKVQAFFVFDFETKDTVALPSIAYGERHVRCTVVHVDKNIGIRGHIIRRHLSDTCKEESVRVTVSFVNFRHDRWKKTSVSVKLTNPCSFEIPNILSWNAIDGPNSGYIFDVNRYPEYSENGTWLLMCLLVDGDSIE